MKLFFTTTIIRVLLLLAVFISGSKLSHAQTVTIPTLNGSDSTDRRPYGCYYGYERTEALYTSSEMGTTGNVTKVGFYLNSTVDAAINTPVVIKMKTTAATTLTSATYATETTGATTVWSGNITSSMLTNNTWVTVTLNTPINVPSSTNLIILVETNYGANGGETAHAKDFRLNKTGSNQTQLWYQDISAPTDNGVLSKMRPNIQLTFDAASCSGTPVPGATLSNANPVCTNSSFTLSMANISVGAGLTYQWKSSTDNVTYTDVSSATNSTYTTSITAAKYFKCKVTCTNSGGNAESTPLQITLKPFYNCYCASYATTTEDTKIDSVKFLTISTGTDPYLCQSYTDYTSFSTSVTPTQAYSIHIANGSCIGDESGAWAAVYIDYDHDGTFAQTNELAASYGPITDIHSIPNQTFFVPGTALAGLTGMRVIVKQGTEIPSYCGSYTRGETEDYLVNIIAITACSGNPVVGATLSTFDSVCCNETFTLSLASYPSSTGISYQWQTSTDGSNYSSISGATSQTFTTSQCAATYYRCKVVCNNGGGTTYSASLKVEMNLFYYCYCNSHASSSADTRIDTVIFSNLKSYSNLIQCASYTDNTAMASANIVKNATSTLQISNGSCDSGQFYESHVAVFIDYNHNGLFTDLGETVYTYGPTTGLYSIPDASILVPANATEGITGMRVVLEEGDSIPSSCGTYTWGETEDYLVNITATALCIDPPTAGFAAASIDSVCASSTPVNVDLSLSGNSSGLGQTYQWQSSIDGTNYFDISGATNTTYTATGVTVSTWYHCNVHCGNNTVASSADMVKVKPTPVGNTYNDPIIVPSLPYYTTNNNKSSNCWTSNYTLFNAQASPDVYYKISTDTICELHVSTCATPLNDLNTYLHLLSSTGTHLKSVNDDGDDCAGTKASIVYNVSSYPATFYAVVEGLSTAEGNYNLEIHCVQYLSNATIADELQATIYPNPNSGDFTLSFDLQNNLNDEGTLTITNAIGKIISKENISVVNGRLKKDISLKSSDDGLYIAYIQLKNSSLNKRFIIQH